MNSPERGTDRPLSGILLFMKKNELFSVIYHDEHLVVLNKSSGLLVAADRWDPDALRLDTLASKELCEKGERLYAVHRIDKDTSGLVMYATCAKPCLPGTPGQKNVSCPGTRPAPLAGYRGNYPASCGRRPETPERAGSQTGETRDDPLYCYRRMRPVYLAGGRPHNRTNAPDPCPPSTIRTFHSVRSPVWRRQTGLSFGVQTILAGRPLYRAAPSGPAGAPCMENDNRTPRNRRRKNLHSTLPPRPQRIAESAREAVQNRPARQRLNR